MPGVGGSAGAWQQGALECPTGSSQVGRGAEQPVARGGLHTDQGDPFSHCLSMGVPAKEERGTVARGERKSLQVRGGTKGWRVRISV